MTLDDIRTAFRTDTAVPEAALRAATGHAEALAAEVYALAEKFGRGVYLLPDQERLLFYGLHVLAAARHSGLYACLVTLLRQNKGDLDGLFPDHGSISMAQLMLSVWDGNSDALFHMIEHADLGETAKWALFDVLARLTFDGRIPRERTAAFLARFETAPLADEDDSAWWAWEDAVTRLGLTELEPALKRVWEKPANTSTRPIDSEDSLEELRHMAANPSDAEPFVADFIMQVDDPVDALGWLTRRSERFAQWLQEREAANGPRPVVDDPARDVRLTPDEQHWLAGFLSSAQVSETTLPFDALDGFVTALIIGPTMVMPSGYLPIIWGEEADAGPEWDSPEQADYVRELIAKHWNAIATRRTSGGPIVPTMVEHVVDDARGADWAYGFEVGMALHDAAWNPLFDNRRAAALVWPVLDLAYDPSDKEAEPVSAPRREQILEQLPTLLQRISDFWKDPSAAVPVAQPVRSTKVGRNDPCPCGAGKKYKKCCGNGAATLH